MELLGTGTFAKVYKEGRYAIKKFTNTTDFILELGFLQYIAQRQHKFIISLIGFTSHNELVLPCGNFNLWHKISKVWPQIFSEALLTEKWQIMLDLLAGVEYLHSINIIHTDLKPENIIFIGTNKLKIIDLNSALFKKTAIMEYTKELTTIWYRAPELLIERDFTEAIDLWSCGIIIYMIFTEQILFLSKTPAALLAEIRNFHRYPIFYLRPTVFSKIHDAEKVNTIKNIISTLLHGHPDHRKLYRKILFPAPAIAGPLAKPLAGTLRPALPGGHSRSSQAAPPGSPQSVTPDDLFSIFHYCHCHEYNYNVYFLAIYIYKLYPKKTENNIDKIKYCCIHLAYIFLNHHSFGNIYPDEQRDIIMQTNCDFLVFTYFDYIRIFEQPIRSLVLCLLVCVSVFQGQQLQDSRLIVCYCELLALSYLGLIELQENEFKNILRQFYNDFFAKPSIFVRSIFMSHQIDLRHFCIICNTRFF